MNGRERFLCTLSDKASDRPPLFEDGIRDEVLKLWRSQGFEHHQKLETLFTYDIREEIEPDLEPLPAPSRWPKDVTGLQKFSGRLDPYDPRRLPREWQKKTVELKRRDYPLILRVHRGYFLTMGVHGWRRFTDAIQLLIDDPKLVEAWLELQAEFVCKLVEEILQDVQVDAVLFSEPIGGNHGPLISPAMYQSMILKSYRPILNLLKSHKVNIIIYRTYANTRSLLPAVVKAGFSCLWACETDPKAMDYLKIRQEFGKDLKLIGGIDSDCLRYKQKEISQAVMQVVPPLLESGGYVPLADGRVREDVPFANYAYYRKLLEQVVAGH